MSTPNFDLELVKRYIHGASMLRQENETSERMVGYYAALDAVLDFIKILERNIEVPEKTG